MGDVLNDIQKGVGELNLSTGYAITTVGQSSQLDATFSALFGALILSILLMYMLMAALYESFIYPLAVIACWPVALVGAIFGLLLDGDTLNVFSMIGMIMLMGLVAKNAILLVDYTNTLRRRGLSRREALLEAGPTRLRPITMTTVTLFCHGSVGPQDGGRRGIALAHGHRRDRRHARVNLAHVVPGPLRIHLPG